MFVLDGVVTLHHGSETTALHADDYAYIPPDTPHRFALMLLTYPHSITAALGTNIASDLTVSSALCLMQCSNLCTTITAHVLDAARLVNAIVFTCTFAWYGATCVA